MKNNCTLLNELALPIHPKFSTEDTISSWINTLAKENAIEFDIMLMYIGNLANHYGFFPALEAITSIPSSELKLLKNELRERFWENNTDCAINNCSYKTNNTFNLKRHLAFKHNLGVTWYTCGKCNFKSRSSENLTRHLASQHDIGAKWYKCPNCDYKAKDPVSVKIHLQYTHNINLLRLFLNSGDDARVRTVDLDDDGYTGVVTLDMNGVRAGR